MTQKKWSMTYMDVTPHCRYLSVRQNDPPEDSTESLDFTNSPPLSVPERVALTLYRINIRRRRRGTDRRRMDRHRPVALRFPPLYLEEKKKRKKKKRDKLTD